MGRGEGRQGSPRIGTDSQLPLPIEAGGQTLFTAMLSQEGVRLPGDRRRANRLQTREAGVAISDDLHQRLLAYCS